MFTVKSAYRVGLDQQMQEHSYGATSTRPDGARPEWKIIWNCQVPPKVKILAWKVCCNALATQANMARRGMATSRTCQICGREDEDTYHAFMRCPHARDLWCAMKEVWDMPPNTKLRHTGRESLLHLLTASPVNHRATTLMTLWRIWHDHNEITHDKPLPSIEGSRRFLVSYLNSLLLIKQHPDGDVEKGKMVIDGNLGFQKKKEHRTGRGQYVKKWMKPGQGLAKLNTDGAFKPGEEAGLGMVLRDNEGEVIFSACQEVAFCTDATEVELMAIEEGLKLSLQWTGLPFVVETYCAEAIKLIKEGTPNMSPYAFRIRSIRDLLKERDTTVVKISRVINQASHGLAKLGRIQHRTEFWLRGHPAEVAQAMELDRNPGSGAAAVAVLHAREEAFDAVAAPCGIVDPGAAPCGRVSSATAASPGHDATGVAAAVPHGRGAAHGMAAAEMAVQQDTAATVVDTSAGSSTSATVVQQHAFSERGRVGSTSRSSPASPRSSMLVPSSVEMPPARPQPTRPPPAHQPMIRRSGRHALAEDGAGATDEDMMQKAMRRKAAMNLDTSDHGAPSINFNQFLEKEKLKGNGSNFTDWSRHVRIFLTGVSMQFVLEAPLGPPPPPAVSEDIKNVYETRVTRNWNKRSLARDEVTMRVGNGSKVDVIAVGTLPYIYLRD
ncbi:hypothetical protein QYE76_044217 [Lolium multiflorum]|uniref:Reverse transcriptase zinc-binding domain-containing protein n=1 Tax=Lolium multiflorum TaxID=4521 RepID=A0AAD8TKI9_LOLMU|nr:hypothetical protein QYE76_044217 [Lolium multiflorum]